MVHISMPEWKKVALIKRHGEYYEYDYDSVANDPLFVKVGTYTRMGKRIVIFEMKP